MSKGREPLQRQSGLQLPDSIAVTLFRSDLLGAFRALPTFEVPLAEGQLGGQLDVLPLHDEGGKTLSGECLPEAADALPAAGHDLVVLERNESRLDLRK